VIPTIDGTAFALGMLILFGAGVMTVVCAAMTVGVLRHRTPPVRAFVTAALCFTAVAAFLLARTSTANSIHASMFGLLLVPLITAVLLASAALRAAMREHTPRVHLMTAAHVALIVVAALLLFRWNHTRTREALYSATLRGDVARVRSLLQASGNDRADRELRQRLLVQAAEDVEPELVKSFIEAGADPNAEAHDVVGHPVTPLIAAVRADSFVGRAQLGDPEFRVRQLRTIEHLLARGADPSVRATFDHVTAIELARATHRSEVESLLTSPPKPK
jgi:hypothetical protein